MVFNLRGNQIHMNQKSIDIKKKIHYEQNLNRKVALLVQLADEMFYIDVKEAENYAQQAMVLAQQIGDNEGVYKSKISLGHIEISANRYKEAITLLKSALTHYDRVGGQDSELKKADIYNGLGKAYSEMKNFSKSTDYLQKSHQIYKKHQMFDKQATLLNNIGLVLRKSSKHVEAYEFFNKANDLILQHLDKQGCPIVLFNLGASLNVLGKYDEAEPILRKSYDLSSRQNYILNKSLCLSEIGIIHRARKKYEDAIECFKMSNVQIMKTTHREGIVKNYQNMGMVYYEENKNEKAVDCFNESIHLAQAFNLFELVDVSYKYLSELYKRKGDFEKAFKFYELYHETKITNLSKQNDSKLQSFIIESQIEKLRQQNEIYVIRNIELKKKNDMLRVLSTTDELTGVFNRRYIIEKLGYLTQRIKEGNHATHYLLMIDIDDFKYINDTYGHVTGDYVLRAISQAINASLGSSGLIARYGGDEFLVIFENANKEYVYQKGFEIRQSIEQILSEKDYKVSISGGVSVIDESHTNVDEILTQADDLLYIAKANDKNQICFS